jgi:uncharacterized protein (TIGR02246 family)
MADTSLDDDVRSLYHQLVEAWNRRDASAMASLFSAHGNMIGFDGSMANGTAHIKAHLEPIFASHPTPAFIAKVREVRELGAGTALLRAIAGMVPPRRSDISPRFNAVQSMVAAKESGSPWRIELFQNTPAALDGRPDLKEKMTEELRALMPGTHR